MLCFSRVSNSLLGWQGKVILRRAACLLSSDSKALRPMYRSDYQPSDFQLPRVELSFNLISPENTSVRSRLHLSKRDQSQEKDLVLDGIDISLQSVSVGQLNAGSVLTNPSLLPSQDYFVDEDKLTIRSHVLPQAKEFVVDVAVTLNPKENLSFEIYGPNESITILPGIIHRMEAFEDTIYLEASTPEMQDVVRLSDDYNRTESE